MATDVPLETGYGPGTPPGDNLCNDYAQNLAVAYRSLAQARGDRLEVHNDLSLMLVDRGSPSEFGNIAVARRPLGDREWQDAAERLHVFYSGQDGGPFLVFSAWTTPDLTGVDFGRIGHPPLMLRMPAPVADRAIEGFEIRPVTDAASAEEWERAFVSGFPEPALQPFLPGSLLPERALNATGWRHWIGYLDDRPVATASAYLASTHVDVEYVATLPSARGRGIGGAMTAQATLAASHVPAMLIASDLGRPVYERLGYRALLRYTLWAGHRASRRPSS
ncbi:MAG: GNAT family N-acetyltransferase [Acidimicrobiales bacterium]